MCSFERLKVYGILLFQFYRSRFYLNKKLCRAFSPQADQLILNIPVLKGLLRVNSNKAEKQLQRLQIENSELRILKYQIRAVRRVVNIRKSERMILISLLTSSF